MKRISILLCLLICISAVITSSGGKNFSRVFNRTMSRQATRGHGASTLMLATTTSTENSGLLDYLLPVFEKEALFGLWAQPLRPSLSMVSGFGGS